MNYYFHCQCGHKLTVGRSQSGGEIPCVCGRNVVVPSLSKLSREQATVEPQRTAPVEFQIRGPTSWLMGIAAFSILCLAALIVLNVTQLASLNSLASDVDRQATSSREATLLRTSGEIALLVVHGFIFFGALSMSRLRNFALARAAVTLALFPGISPCLVLGIPVAISALSVLGRSEVKAAFKS